MTDPTAMTSATIQRRGVPITSGVPEAVFELFSTCQFGVCKRPCIAHYDHTIPSTVAG